MLYVMKFHTDTLWSEDPEAAGPPGARASGLLAAGCPENEKVKVKLAELVNNTENPLPITGHRVYHQGLVYV